MYWAGVGHGTRATYHFALRKQYISALREATTAYNYHEHLLKIDPGFVDCYLIIGINDYVVGSLPWYVKVMASLGGRHGNREEGIRQVRIVTERGHYASEDAKLMLGVLYQREKMHEEALDLYQGMARSYPRNYLLEYEVASLLFILKHWGLAAQAYDAILAKRKVTASDDAHVPTAKLLYQSGQAYEHLQQYESALVRYSQAQELPGNERYIYASGLAAANLYEHLSLIQEARVLYQLVANATPSTEEGNAARRALRRLEAN